MPEIKKLSDYFNISGNTPHSTFEEISDGTLHTDNFYDGAFFPISFLPDYDIFNIKINLVPGANVAANNPISLAIVSGKYENNTVVLEKIISFSEPVEIAVPASEGQMPPKEYVFSFKKSFNKSLFKNGYIAIITVPGSSTETIELSQIKTYKIKIKNNFKESGNNVCKWLYEERWYPLSASADQPYQAPEFIFDGLNDDYNLNAFIKNLLIAAKEKASHTEGLTTEAVLNEAVENILSLSDNTFVVADENTQQN